MPDFGGFVARDISFMHKIVNRMRYLFYNKFLAKPVDGTDASDESQCGENTGLSVCSFSPSKQKTKKMVPSVGYHTSPAELCNVFHLLALFLSAVSCCSGYVFCFMFCVWGWDTATDGKGWWYECQGQRLQSCNSSSPSFCDCWNIGTSYKITNSPEPYRFPRLRFSASLYHPVFFFLHIFSYRDHSKRPFSSV